LIIADERLTEALALLLSFTEVEAFEAKPPKDGPNLRSPLMVLPTPAERGEVLHNHRSLAATAISIGHFHMLAEEITLLMVEPPTRWYTLALML